MLTCNNTGLVEKPVWSRDTLGIWRLTWFPHGVGKQRATPPHGTARPHTLGFVFLIWPLTACSYSIMAVCACDTVPHVAANVGKDSRFFYYTKGHFLSWWREQTNTTFVPGLWMCSRRRMSAADDAVLFSRHMLASSMAGLKVSMKPCHSSLLSIGVRVATSFNYLKFMLPSLVPTQPKSRSRRTCSKVLALFDVLSRRYASNLPKTGLLVLLLDDCRFWLPPVCIRIIMHEVNR